MSSSSSMNLHQSFGYDPINAGDPLGLLVVALFHGSGSDRNTVQYVPGGPQAGMNLLERMITDYAAQQGSRAFVFYSLLKGSELITAPMLRKVEALRFGKAENRPISEFEHLYRAAGSDIKIFNVAGSSDLSASDIASGVLGVSEPEEPILLVGHSIGALTAIHVARELGAIGKSVGYLATLDLETEDVLGTFLVSKKIPSNVRCFENFFTLGFGLGGTHGYETSDKTVALGEHTITVGHTEIDESPRVLNVLMDRVRSSFERRPFLPAHAILPRFPLRPEGR